MSTGSSHREARLAEALRANLRRRKSQARAQTEVSPSAAGGDEGADDNSRADAPSEPKPE